jgi:hypothetical protein
MRYLYYVLGVLVGFGGFLLFMDGLSKDVMFYQVLGGSMVGSCLILVAVGRVIETLDDIRDAVSEEPE